jgi:fatty-acyl-CoA synthase
MVFADRTAVIHHHRTYTYRELSARVQSLATVLINTYQVKQGDRVAVICSNIPPNLEATYAIPAVGAIIVPVNTRLAAQEIEYIIRHSGAKVIILQRDFKDKITQSVANSVQIIDVADGNETDPYERLLMNCTFLVAWDKMPLLYDENATISINYTSGSTGRPKGVMVTYRGAYLAALGMIVQCALSANTVYLWTLPMFHCNGNCFIG